MHLATSNKIENLEVFDIGICEEEIWTCQYKFLWSYERKAKKIKHDKIRHWFVVTNQRKFIWAL